MEHPTDHENYNITLEIEKKSRKNTINSETLSSEHQNSENGKNKSQK
jgi:hypothetical protein